MLVLQLAGLGLGLAEMVLLRSLIIFSLPGCCAAAALPAIYSAPVSYFFLFSAISVSPRTYLKIRGPIFAKFLGLVQLRL